MAHDLTELANHRDALLLAEVAAWLHMLGKFHEDFLKGQHDLDIQIPSDLTGNFAHLDQLLRDLSWARATWNKFSISELQANSLSFFNFMEKHRTRTVTEGLLKLMWDAHGRGSGVEKGVLNRFAPGQTTTVYQSTAFGTETDAIDLNGLNNERQKLYDFLQTNLESLKNSLTASSVNWQEFRQKFTSIIKDYFLQTVAETRRPLSDVSLFDQTAASVTFLKAALAQSLLLGWKDPITNAIADKYHWRLLRIGLDGLAFWGDSVRISDLLARKQLITEALNRVQKAIEEDYPFGLEVYRDESGSIFIVPDVADLLNATVDSRSPLSEHLQEIANYQFKGEAGWTLELSDRTRNTLRFGKLATAPLSKPTANPAWSEPYWNIKEKHDICPVCDLRPISSSKKVKVCDTCSDRRTNRAKDWTENLPTTIWIDEVADSNARLALITARFELESWLTGEAFSSMISFDPISRRMHNKKKDNRRTGEKAQEFDFSYFQLISDIEGETFTSTQDISSLDNLVENLNRGGSFEQFYDLQVTDTDLGEGRTTKEPFLLALAMMRQNPSFARLRRAWETTQRFWQEALAGVPEAQLPKVKGRLTIEATNIDGFRLQPFGNYDLVLGKTKLSVLHDNGKLITTDNLRYTAKQLGAKSEEYTSDEAAVEFVRQHLLNQQVPIEEPTGYGSPNKLRGNLNISEITPEPIEYTPVIPILAEPRTFMALVPAEKSLEVIKAIKTKYEREMGKVRNRLPLHLGVVYFHRRTPLRAALDAGRQMLTYKTPEHLNLLVFWTKWYLAIQATQAVNVEKLDLWFVSLAYNLIFKRPQQLWQISKIQCLLTPDKEEPANGTQQFKKTIVLDLFRDTYTINWRVPVAMGDGTTTDVWYPYVFLNTNDNDNTVTTKRQRAIKACDRAQRNPVG